MLKKIYKKILLLVIIILTNNCVDPFEFEDQIETNGNTLVVEAIITNEFIRHEILLSRVFGLGVANDDPPILGEGISNVTSPEANATVRMIDDLQNEIIFQEEGTPGTYVSTIAFNPALERSYQLMIATTDGSSYISESVGLTSTTAQIENIEARLTTNLEGIEGVGVFVDSFDPTGEAEFYRYEYEETYIVIAPLFTSVELFILSRNPLETEVGLKTNLNTRVCYPTDFSSDILITNTNELSEERVSNFQTRFIRNDDFIISDRYSILVRQFVQSAAANTFYETLREFSNSETLFLQVQPGLVPGNIRSLDGENSNVLGLFEMSSVSERRIFFDREEFFPPFPRPDFPTDCLERANAPDSDSEILRLLDIGYIFLGFNEGQLLDSDGLAGGITLVPRECGDCTPFGTNIVPDFWVD